MYLVFALTGFLLLHCSANPLDIPEDKHKIACEGEYLVLVCPAGERIHVERANFGRFSPNECNPDGVDYPHMVCRDKGSIDKVRELCHNRTQCRVSASNSTFNDACPKLRKYLQVEYLCLKESTVAPSPMPTSGQVISGDADSDDTPTEPLPECRAETRRGVSWPTTTAGKMVLMPCPNNRKGKAAWFCNDVGTWTPSEPNLQRCVSEELLAIAHEASDAQPIDADSVLGVTSALERRTRVPESLYGGDAVTVSETLEHLVDVARASQQTDEGGAGFAMQFAKHSIATANNLLTGDRSSPMWTDIAPEYRRLAVQRVMSSVERTGGLLGSVIEGKNTETQNKPNLLVESSVVPTDIDVRVPWLSITQPDLDVIQIPAEALKATASSDDTSRVTFASYAHLAQLLPPTPRPTGFRTGIERVIVSRVVAASLQEHVEGLEKPVYVVMRLTGKEQNLTNVQCVFWDSDSLDWSTEGMELVDANETHATCAASHLTHFAVLMDVMGTELAMAHTFALTLVTYIGCIISCACLILAIIVFICVRPRTNTAAERQTLHANLCFTLLAAELLFLFGISATDSPYPACTGIAVALHYFFLSAFCWMLLEGFQLYAMLVDVFEAERSRVKWFYVFAYGLPLLVVATAAAIDIDSYGTNEYCWLRADNYFVFSFVGPVVVVIAANLFFLIMALSIMHQHRNITINANPKNAKSPFRMWLRAATVLVVLLGLTWSLGLFYVNHDTVIIAYAFTALNSLQGFFIFLFHVALNDTVRDDFARFLHRHRSCLPSCCVPRVESRTVVSPLRQAVEVESAAPLCGDKAVLTQARSMQYEAQQSFLSRVFAASTKRQSSQFLIDRSSGSSTLAHQTSSSAVSQHVSSSTVTKQSYDYYGGQCSEQCHCSPRRYTQSPHIPGPPTFAPPPPPPPDTLSTCASTCSSCATQRQAPVSLLYEEPTSGCCSTAGYASSCSGHPSRSCSTVQAPPPPVIHHAGMIYVPLHVAASHSFYRQVGDDVPTEDAPNYYGQAQYARAQA